MFELTEQDVFRLAEFFADSDLEFLRVTAKDVEVVLSRSDDVGGTSPERANQAIAAPAPASTPATGAAAASAEPRGVPDQGEPGSGTAAHEAAGVGSRPGPAAEGTVTIVAPSVGVFYRAPSPDLPVYVEVGGTVQPDTTVALLEAMKVFTAVTAGVGGTVVEVLAENNALVEHGQPLFRVAPSL